MKRSFLRKLDLNKETIDKIMEEYGKDINSLKREKETLTTELKILTSKYEELKAIFKIMIEI